MVFKALDFPVSHERHGVESFWVTIVKLSIDNAPWVSCFQLFVVFIEFFWFCFWFRFLIFAPKIITRLRSCQLRWLLVLKVFIVVFFIELFVLNFDLWDANVSFIYFSTEIVSILSPRNIWNIRMALSRLRSLIPIFIWINDFFNGILSIIILSHRIITPILTVIILSKLLVFVRHRPMHRSLVLRYFFLSIFLG